MSNPETLPNITISPSLSFVIALGIIPRAGIEFVPLLSANLIGISLPEGVLAEGSKATTEPAAKVEPVVFFPVRVSDKASSDVTPVILLPSPYNVSA